MWDFCWFYNLNTLTHLCQDLAVNLDSLCVLLNESEVSKRTKCSRHWKQKLGHAAFMKSFVSPIRTHETLQPHADTQKKKNQFIQLYKHYAGGVKENWVHNWIRFTMVMLNEINNTVLCYSLNEWLQKNRKQKKLYAVSSFIISVK